MAGYFDKGWVCGIVKDKYYVYALIFDSQSENSPVGNGTAKTLGTGRDNSSANIEGAA